MTDVSTSTPADRVAAVVAMAHEANPNADYLLAIRPFDGRDALELRMDDLRSVLEQATLYRVLADALGTAGWELRPF